MTDASRDLSFGIPSLAGTGRSEFTSAGSRQQDTASEWHYVTLAIAVGPSGPTDGCWF